MIKIHSIKRHTQKPRPDTRDGLLAARKDEATKKLQQELKNKGLKP